jgi:hypothetical protein
VKGSDEDYDVDPLGDLGDGHTMFSIKCNVYVRKS